MPVLDAAAEGEALARLLLARRAVAASQVEAARREAALRGGRLATAFLSADAIDLDTLATVLAEVHGIDGAGPDDFAAIPAEALQALPAKAAIRHLAVPVRRSARVLHVAFVEPAQEAVDAVERATGMEVRAYVAPEPLVYEALTKHFFLARVPKPLERIVRAVSDGTVRRHAGAIPEDPEEYVTTPMGGVVPSLPDEVTTNSLMAAPALSPDDILLGAGGDDPFGRALVAISMSEEPEAAWRIALDLAASGFEAAALLSRDGADWALTQGAGALASAGRVELGEARRSVLEKALAAAEGFRGAAPDTPSDALLSEALGREPKELAVLPLSTAARHEVLLWADAGGAALDGAKVDELRTIARRIRERFDRS